MAVDGRMNTLIVQAKPTQLKTIKAILDDMQKDGKTIEVIKLRHLDPQEAVLMINQLWGSDPAAAANAPKVVADVANMQITIMEPKPTLRRFGKCWRRRGKPAKSKRPVRAAASQDPADLPHPERTINKILDQAATAWESTHPVGSNKIIFKSSRNARRRNARANLRTGPSTTRTLNVPTTRKCALPASLIPGKPPE